jgi:hypothetical protein
LHLWGPIGEKKKYFWIIDWFPMVDFLYLIPPNEGPKCLKDGVLFQTSQLNDGGFGHI